MYKRKDNNFSEKTRELFIYNYACWECGMNTWDCLHHIMSGEYSNSAFNAAPLCNSKCHINGGHYFSDECKKKFLNSTAVYLIKNLYKPSENDKNFILLHKDYYNKDVLKKIL